MGRTGTATLPLHYGHVPPWLSTRMASLGRVITQAVILHYGRDEYLRRLAHPGWFQAFGAVMGMDWHSSGITTSVLGALKRGLAPVERELGLHVCGGRGNESRKTPSELLSLSDRVGLDGDSLVRTSRLVAKVDSAAIQDGYDIYLHGFIVADDGKWTVVQQGMCGARKEARRYHWLSERLTDFVDSPHAAIDGPPAAAPIVNLTDHRASASRDAQIMLVMDGPDRVVREVARLRPSAPALELPFHHEVRAEDVVLRRLRGAIAAAHERGPKDFADLLLTPGVGPRTVFSLALVAEVVHGAPSRFSDPARYSLAHGGKDGHPYPVPTRVYDETIRVMKDAIAKAKLGLSDRLFAIQRLDAEVRRLEQCPGAVDFDAFIEAEWEIGRRLPREYPTRAVSIPSGRR
ncbi:MAG TPA: DUF763 domain-containing protein [Gemmatimonadaceae bacterium]|nr:DUF763 domain-containing protein [Gemmatimonadaceae bacterium]